MIDLIVRSLEFIGDDETVRIWDVCAKKSRQVIRDHGGRWGQITCVAWLAGENGDASLSLCFGTGRGRILIYRRSKTGVSVIEWDDAGTNFFCYLDAIHRDIQYLYIRFK